MKKFNLLFPFGTAILITACSSDNVNEPTLPSLPNTEGMIYEVSLSMGGEFVEVSESPMSRATEAPAPKNYYGVNVYCMKTDGTEYNYSKYAYGVFDNVNDMKISLLEGYKYKFECTTVKEIDNYRIVSEDGNISFPFKEGTSLSSSGSTFFKGDLNKFQTSDTFNLFKIKEGYTIYYPWYSNGNDYYVSNTCYSNYPSLDRFYGELEDFTPSPSGVATIHLKRTAFGLNLVINGVPDGSLSWFDNSLTHYDNNETTSTNNTEQTRISHIYTFYEIYKCWQNPDSYTQDFTIEFVWTRSNGFQQKFSKTFTAKRNVITTLTVNLEGGANNISFGLQEDDTEMGSENENVDYNGGALTDTEVDTKE